MIGARTSTNTNGSGDGNGSRRASGSGGGSGSGRRDSGDASGSGSGIGKGKGSENESGRWGENRSARAAGDLPTRLLHAAAAITLTVSGYIHAQLYLDGYRFIHAIGVMFLIQAAASFALATLLLAAAVLDPPVLVQLAAAGAALGALAGFAASRTVGVFGFTERGFQPAPQALISVLAEVATILLLAIAATRLVRRRGGIRTLVNGVFT